MGSTEQIIKVIDPEIIPKPELTGLLEALQYVATREAELAPLKADLENLQVVDDESYRVVGERVQKVREISKAAEDKLGPYKKRLNDAKTTILGWIAAAQEPADAIAKIGAEKQAAWNKKKREENEAEERRQQQKARDEQNRKAELQRQEDERIAKERRDARVKEIRADLAAGKYGDKKTAKAKREAQKQLELAGASEEAALAKASADAAELAAKVPEVKLEEKKTTVAGQRARAPFVWKMVDITKIPRELLYPMPGDDGTYDVSDFPRITSMVKDEKDKKKSEAKAGGGILVWQDDRV